MLLGRHPASRARVVAALAVVYFVWGSCYLVSKLALRDFPPFLLSSLRNLLAGALLLPLLARMAAAAPPRGRRTRSALVALLAVVGATGGATLALGTVSSGAAAMVFALTPLWMVLLGCLGGIRPRPRELAGLALGLGAVAALGAGGGLGGSGAGLAALLVASLCWAAGSELARRQEVPFEPVEVAQQMLLGGLVLLAASLVMEPLPAALPRLQAWLALSYLGLMGSGLSYLCYQYLLAHTRPAMAASHAYVNPVVAVALGWLVLGEALTAASLASMGMALGAVALSDSTAT